MARIIGEAAVRLTADGRGLAADMRFVIKRALTEAAISVNDDSSNTTSKIEKDGERTAGKLRGVFSDLGTSIGKSLGGALNVAQGSVGLVLLGAKAGIALALVTNLTTGLIGLGAALGTVAGGAAAALPAVLLTGAAAAVTLKVGLSGVGDAFKALASGDAAKFQESLAGLAPAARQTLTALAQFKPALDQVKQSTQQALFDGLATPLTQLARTQLPQVKTLLTGIAGSFNEAARSSLGFLNSSAATSQLRLLFDNIGGAIHGVTGAFQPLIAAFLRIASIGSEFIPGLTDRLTGLAEKFNSFIQSAADSGALANFFGTAIGIAGQLGNVLKNVFGILHDIFSTASQVSGGALGNLQQITASIHGFTSSDSGREALIGFFTAMRDITSSLLPVFVAIARVVGTTLAPILASLARTIGPALTPLVDAFGAALQAAAPGIQGLASGVAALFTAAGPALTALGRLAGVIGQSLGAVLEKLAPVLNDVITALADALTQALSDPAIVDGLVSLGKAIGDIVIALVPLLPPLARLVGPLLQRLADILNALKPIIDPIVKLFSALVDIVVKIIRVFDVLLPVLDFVSKALGVVVDVITALVKAVGFLIDKVKEFFDFVGSVVGNVVDALDGHFDHAGQLTTNLSDKFGEMSGRINTSIGNVTVGLSKWTDDNTANLERFSGAVGLQLGAGALAADNFRDRFTSALQTFTDQVGGSFGSVIKQTDDFQKRFTISMAEFTGSLGGAAGSAVDFSTKTGTAFQAAADQVQASVSRILGITSAAVGPLGAAGTAAGGSYAGGVSAGGGLAARAAQSTVDSMTAIFGNTAPFGAAGSALISAFASGMSSKAAAAKAAAGQIMSGVAALFPHSPAKEGPFSGSGYTLVRGGKLISDFAAGMLAELASAHDAATLVATTFSDPLDKLQLGAPGSGATGGFGAPGGVQQLVLQQTNIMQPGTDAVQFAADTARRAAQRLAGGGSALPVQIGQVQDGMAAPGTLTGVGGSS